MALTPYTPADALPDLVGGSGGPIQLHQDGDVPTHDTLMQSSSADRGVIGKLLNGLYYVSRRTLGSYGGTRTLATLAELASQAVGSEGAKLVGVGGSVGAAMTLPTGTLQELADWLADHVPALTTLGAVDGETLIGVDDYAGTNWTIPAGTLRTFLRTLADNAWSLGVNVPHVTGRRSTVLNPALSTFTINPNGGCAAIIEHHFTGTAATDIVITLSDYTDSGPANPEIMIVMSTANQSGAQPTWSIKNGGGTTQVKANALTSGATNHQQGATVHMRWNGSAWKCVEAASSANDAIDFSQALYS